MDAKDIANLLQAGSITVAALSAVYGINAWRRQLIGSKRAEIAEKALTTFYEARDILQAARSPASFGDEGRTRQREPGETDAQARHRDALYAPAERLLKQREFFMGMNASRYQVFAYFGADAAAPFDAIMQVRFRVLTSTRMLLTSPDRDLTNEMIELRHQWERDIWAIRDGDDKLTQDVERAVAEMEALCRPALEERGRRWWDGKWSRVRELARGFAAKAAVRARQLFARWIHAKRG